MQREQYAVELRVIVGLNQNLGSRTNIIAPEGHFGAGSRFFPLRLRSALRLRGWIPACGAEAFPAVAAIIRPLTHGGAQVVQEAAARGAPDIIAFAFRAVHGYPTLRRHVPESLIRASEKQNSVLKDHPIPATARRALGDFSEDGESLSDWERG